MEKSSRCDTILSILGGDTMDNKNYGFETGTIKARCDKFIHGMFYIY